MQQVVTRPPHEGHQPVCAYCIVLERLGEVAASLGYDCQQRTQNDMRLQLGESPIVMLLETATPDDAPVLYWVVRNNSFHFNGDRSDINFACTVLFAGWMSHFLQTSFELQEIGHAVLDFENDGYLVIPRQPQNLGVALGTPFDSLQMALHLQHGFEHNLADLLDYEEADSPATESDWSSEELDRLTSPRSKFAGSVQRRQNPAWDFYHRTDSGLVIARSPALSLEISRVAGRHGARTYGSACRSWDSEFAKTKNSQGERHSVGEQ